MSTKAQHRSGQEGFSYIDTMIALVILMIGILGYMAALSAGVIMTRGQQTQLTARHIAATTLESIMAAKETDPLRLGWITVGNVDTNPDVNGNFKGVFVKGFQQVRSGAGPDEVVGTADDNGDPVAGYTRRITITDICDPDRPSYNCPTPDDWPVKMRQVVVEVNYFANSLQRTERVATILTDYSEKD